MVLILTRKLSESTGLDLWSPNRTFQTYAVIMMWRYFTDFYSASA